ncbi:unnamed protein product [Sympodiomycopsis kandeliae]
MSGPPNVKAETEQASLEEGKDEQAKTIIKDDEESPSAPPSAKTESTVDVTTPAGVTKEERPQTPEVQDVPEGRSAVSPSAASASTLPSKRKQASIDEQSKPVADVNDASDEPVSYGPPGSSSSSSRSRPEPTKRPRKDFPDAASRGRRMFGILNATLGKAKSESEATREQAARRAEIEKRQKERLKARQEEQDRLATLKKASQIHSSREIELCQELLAGEASHRSIRASKRRLASFLVTSNGMSSTAREDRRYAPVASSHHIAPNVPSSLPPLPPRSQNEYPIYFLPRKLTLKQEDKLDDQEDQVDEEIEKAEKDWEMRRDELRKELEAVRGELERLQQKAS